MGMSDFNRANPFIIIMRDKSDIFNDKMIKTIKTNIYVLVLFAILVIMGLIMRMNICPFIIYIILESMWNGLLIFTTLKSADLRKINDMIYGDEYKNVNVNNEMILNIIEKINFVHGKVDFIYEKLLHDVYTSIILFIIILIINIIY